MFLFDQVSGIVRNVNIGIFSDTLYVINFQLCRMVLHIGFYLFIALLVTLTLFLGHGSVKQF